MNKKVEILAMGIDLANDYTQIAVIDNPDSNESKGIPASRGNTDCLIRSVLYISREGTWHIGDDAVKRAEMDGGECAEDIVNIMLSGGELQYNGSVYSAYELMRGYLNACIEHVRFLYVDISIKEICITAVDNPKVFTDNASKALGTLGFFTLSLHDALPICPQRTRPRSPRRRPRRRTLKLQKKRKNMMLSCITLFWRNSESVFSQRFS